jgi:predicted O-linked N-acetylglucosamine transferase (SPINDLY family)
MAEAPEPGWRPAADGSVCIGSFNGLGKLTPQTLALWARVLHALPEGRLLLKNKGLADAENRRRILEIFGGHGIAADRIELQPDSDWADYMAQHDRLDIALDPVGARGGGTSTCDALWMGCPVIHALGDRATSRFTASMLDAIGHPEWIARSETEYVDKVVTLARDVGQRKALRLVQRERMAASPLCDAENLARRMENAYLAMFERWLESTNG